MLENKTNKDIGECVRTLVRTSFAGQKEVLSSIEEASTLGNCSGSSNANPQHL